MEPWVANAMGVWVKSALDCWRGGGKIAQQQISSGRRRRWGAKQLKIGAIRRTGSGGLGGIDAWRGVGEKGSGTPAVLMIWEGSEIKNLTSSQQAD